MVRDDAIERIAIDAAIAYNPGRWQVEGTLSADNKGFDLVSRGFAPGQPGTPIDLRYIEVKGRAHVGLVSLSQNEYNTAYHLASRDYWLYTPSSTAPPRPRSTPCATRCICLGADAAGDPVSGQRRGGDRPGQPAGRAAQPGGSCLPGRLAGRLADLGPYNILLVEGLSDKVYLELAAQKHLEATGVDLLAAPNGPGTYRGRPRGRRALRP